MAAADSCVDCHQEPELRIKNRELYDYYQQWIQSNHQRAGVHCSDCHGGDPTATNKDTAHGPHIQPRDPESPIRYQHLSATCGQCHQAVCKNFRESQHFRSLRHDQAAPHCGTYHDAMNARIEHQLVEPECGTCHDGRGCAM